LSPLSAVADSDLPDWGKANDEFLSAGVEAGFDRPLLSF